MAMRGVYREIVPPERVVRTDSFVFGREARASRSLATLALSEQAGRTLKLTILYPSKEARDAAIAAGMERGWPRGYDRMDKILASSVQA